MAKTNLNIENEVMVSRKVFVFQDFANAKNRNPKLNFHGMILKFGKIFQDYDFCLNDYQKITNYRVRSLGIAKFNARDHFRSKKVCKLSPIENFKTGQKNFD